MSESHGHAQSVAHTETPRSKLGKIWDDLRHFPSWAKQNPLRAMIAIGVVGVVALVSTVGGSYVLVTQVIYTEPPPDPLVEAFKALDHGELPAARKLALEVAKERKHELLELSDPLFILGVSISRSADLHWNPEERRPLYAIASRYLEQSKRLGFPKGRESEGYYRLGRCLHFTARYREALAELGQHLQLQAEHRSDATELMAEASLLQTPADFVQAKALNAKLLTDQNLSPLRKLQAQLREGQIMFAQGELESAKKIVEAIPATSPLSVERALLLGKVFLAAGDFAQSKNDSSLAINNYKSALEAFRSIPSRDIPLSTIATTQYLMSQCYQRQGELAAAEKQWDFIRRQYRRYPEFAAATLDMARDHMMNKNYPEAVAILQELLGSETDPEQFRNPYFSLEKLKDEVASIRDQLLAAEEFEACLELSRGPEGLIPAWQFAEWTARTYQARANNLEQRAAIELRSQAAVFLAEARKDHRQSSLAFAKLSDYRISTKHYIDDLWNAVSESYLGRDFSRTVAQGQKYLQLEANRMRPEALVAVGDSLLCLGKIAQARESFQECLTEFPRHPITYRARLFAAQAEVEQQRLHEAMALLQENVTNDELSPRSLEWQDSLFLLGKLHVREALEWGAKSRLAGVDSSDPDKMRLGLRDLEQSYQAHRRAIENLSRAVERFPQATQAHEARYLLAEAHRHAADWPLKRLKVITIESTRLELTKQGDQYRRDAVALYDQAISGLQQQATQDDPTPLEMKLLRNCYFGKAGTLFDLNRFEEAVKTYSAATYRFQNEPEALEAYVRIAACYRLLNRPKEARGTLEQAKVMLKRLPSETNFAAATPYTREEWDELLTWLATL